jgi:DNA-directed RNA polymerase specialized sigma subunit
METIAEQISDLTTTLEALLVERNKQVIQAANEGEPQASIARRYGITRARVCQLVEHFRRLEKVQDDA